jgi:hypothetical protein
MGTHWSFGVPNGKTVQAIILPEMTGRADFRFHEKLKERIGEEGVPTADDIKAALEAALHEHGLYATKLSVR